MEDRRLPDQSFSSSSRLTRAHSPWRARLHGQPGSFQPAGWAPRRNDRSPWLQVDLKTPTVISGVGTQGGRYFWWSRGGWVISYKLSFSADGKLWKRYGQNTTEEVIGYSMMFIQLVKSKDSMCEMTFNKSPQVSEVQKTNHLRKRPLFEISRFTSISLFFSLYTTFYTNAQQIIVWFDCQSLSPYIARWSILCWWVWSTFKH